jgi:hypothetical protein
MEDDHVGCEQKFLKKNTDPYPLVLSKREKEEPIIRNNIHARE